MKMGCLQISLATSDRVILQDCILTAVCAKISGDVSSIPLEM